MPRSIAGSIESTSSTSGPRKYLCAAPRPENWEEAAEAVLSTMKRMKHSHAKNAAMIQHTIATIQQKHDIQIKTGPGRKSNAEHALHFYEYLLERLKEKANLEIEEEDVNDNDDDVEEEEDDEDSQEEDDGESEMNENEKDRIIVEHNDECDVCETKDGDDDQKISVKCSQCPRVFHEDCVRPGLDEILSSTPQSGYRCAYCSLEQEPKHTKPRRIAAAAVRLMARLRNQHKRRRDEEDDDDDDDDDDEDDDDRDDTKSKRRRRSVASDRGQEENNSDETEGEDVKKAGSCDSDDKSTKEEEDEKASRTGSSGENDSEGNESTEKDANSNEIGTPSRRQKLALYKLRDSLSPSLTINAESPLRSKRNRKSPSIYDPQTVPARKWQSDEFPVKKDSDEGSDSDSTDSDKDETGSESGDVIDTRNTRVSAKESGDEQSKTNDRGRGRRGPTALCNFCGDDPSIKICCFCACRVCFGKHSQGKLLLCDMCDDEYHTFCLEPPLEKVPAVAWFCPSCKSSKSTGRVSSRTRTVGRPKKTAEKASGSGRKKAGVTKTGEVTTKKRGPGRPPGSGTRRGPGRPPGKPGRPKKTQPTASSTGKKRGRPPSRSPAPSGRKRGRPPKSASKTPSSRGRSRSNDSKRSLSISDDGLVELPSGFVAAPESPAPLKVSRSGRTVKRSSFHDEIEEGDQHLRASRYSLQMQRKAAEEAVAAAIAEGREPPELPPHIQIQNSSSLEDVSPTSATSLSPDLATAVDSEASNLAHLQYGGESVTPLAADTKARGLTITSPAVNRTIPPTPSNTPMVPSANVNKSVSSVMTAAAAALASSAQTSASTRAQDDAGMPPKDAKLPRRKPGARECMQLSRRFGPSVIPSSHMNTLLDYCSRGKVEHLIRMRERLDDHSRYLETQLAGLEALVREKGEHNEIRVPRGVPSSEDSTQIA